MALRLVPAGLLVAALALHVSIAAWPYAVASSRLPHWDQMGRAVFGLQMAEALRHLDFGRFVRLIHESSPWPPLYHVIEAPFFLAFGNHYHVVAALTPFQLFGCILCAYGVGLALGGARGVLIGSIAAALMGSNLIFQMMGSQIMLELPGTLVMLLALIFYIRYCRYDSLRDARVTCVLTLVLFMLKYNYGIMWIVPLVLNEMGHTVPSAAELRDGLVRFVRGRRWLSPFWVAIALYVGALAWMARHPGHFVSIAGRSFAVPGLRDPIVLLLGILALRFLGRARTNFTALRAWFDGLHPAARSFVLIVALPSVIWLVAPIHMKAFLEFMSNRTSHLPLLNAENLLFYPRAFVDDYSPTQGIGLVVLGLGLGGIALIRRLRPEERIIVIALVVGLLFTTAHRFKISRFFFLVAPLIWLSCGITVAWLLDRATRALSPRLRTGITFAAALAVLVLSFAFGYDANRVQDRYERWSTMESVGRVLETIVDVNVASKGTVLIGTWNQLSTGLVEWYQLYYRPGAKGPSRPKNPEWYEDLKPAGLLRHMADDPGVERVIVLSLPPRAPAYSPSFDRENWWVPAVRAALARDPRFRLESVEAFDDSGYQVRVYRKT